MNKRPKIILLLALAIILAVIFMSYHVINLKPKFIYKCSIAENGKEILEINNIKYEQLYDSEGLDLYDGEYVINHELYEKNSIYAVTHVNTQCDDWPVYTLRGLNPKDYVVKIAHDYTGYYDGQAYKKIK